MAPLADAPHPSLALLPSPFLGAASCTPLAERLAGSGWSVTVCPTPERPTGAREVLHSYVDALPAGEPVALVAHSNAGLYVPAVSHGRDLVGTVFVDASLPPAEGRAAVVPAPHQAFLAGVAEADGLLPPWTSWWDEEELVGLLPDPARRSELEEHVPRMRLSYVEETVDVPPGWSRSPCAFLAFGDARADEGCVAARRGWPVESLPGSHLHLLTEPQEVADAVTGLLDRLGVPAPVRG